jgi:hypothetical protein
MGALTTARAPRRIARIGQDQTELVIEYGFTIAARDIVDARSSSGSRNSHFLGHASGPDRAEKLKT